MNRLNEALEVHDDLNPVLWDDMELKDDVKSKLLEIANTFIEGLDFPINVADIRFLGSNASYNYNEHSDIDLHIITNFDLIYVDKDILQQLYNASKNSFNNNHDITIKGIPVELYIEDMNSMNATNGSYSLLNDEWIKVPEPINYDIPDYSEDLQEMINEVEEVLLSTDKEEVEELINRIYLGRKDGLAEDGEASIGNLVFKELRNMDLIEKLKNRFNELESVELTLENKLEEDLEDTQENSDLITQKEIEYREYIDTHIENVKKAYDRIVKQYAEDYLTANQIKQLEDNLSKHDEDKNIPSIFDTYRRNHYPINDEEKEAAEEDYDIAWHYHKTHNPHHWEYWLNSAEEFAQDIDEDAMKLAYFEMLCDWLSFGFRKEETSATGESTEFKVWYGEAKKNIKIHPQLQNWFNKIVEDIMSFIDENKDTLYTENKKHLTKVESCSIINEENVDVNNRKVGENEMTEVDKQKELKRMQEWVNTILEGRKLEESSMSKVAEYISHYQVGFITAFRQGNTKSTNQDRNHDLKLDIIQDLNKTKLSYIKVDGTYPETKLDKDGNPIDGEFIQIFEETFAIINDQYDSNDFIKIMSNLCGKYDQDSVLIVFPPTNSQKKIEDNVTAAEYNKDGKQVATYKGFTVSVYDKYKDKNTDIEEYYTKVGNKKLSFTNRQEVSESIDKEPKFDIYTYRLKKQGNLGGMLEAQRKHYFVEALLKEYSKEKLQEMNYTEYKEKEDFTYDFEVEVPLKLTQESDLDTIEDKQGNDIEMDIDYDSLYDSFVDAEEIIKELFNDEDYLKEIFPNVGRGRVYPELVYIEEDSMKLNIGFSDVVDPVEKGNDIHLDEKEIKSQIKDLVESVIDNIGYIDAKQSYEEYSGYTDEDGDPIYDTEYSDESILFRIELNGEIKIQSLVTKVTENKKLEESNLSRIFNHYKNDPFIVISAERTPEKDETEEQAKQKNKKNTLSLKNDIRSAGFGYIPVDGGWKEDGIVSTEASFFIPKPSGIDYSDFFDWGIEMCKKYGQYAVLISNGEGNIAYYTQEGNVDMEFKGGISFNKNTIDKNIDDDGGVGGFTSLNKKNPNKNFQLQQLKIDKNIINNLAKENAKCDVLKLYADEFKTFTEEDIQTLINTLYNSKLDLSKDSGNAELDDCKLSYSKTNDGIQISLRESKDLIRYKNYSQKDYMFNKSYSNKIKIEENDTNFDILSKYKNADYGFIQDRDLEFIVETLYGKGTKLNEGINDYGDLKLEYKLGKIISLEQK